MSKQLDSMRDDSSAKVLFDRYRNTDIFCLFSKIG